MSASKIQGLVIVAVAIVLLSGCSSYTVAPYRHSTYGSELLRNLNVTDIAVGEFVTDSWAGNSKICPLSKLSKTIHLPKGDTLSSYFRNALISELKAAEVYAEEGAVTLSGAITDVDLVTTNYKGYLFIDSRHLKWEISITVDSSNGESLSVMSATQAPRKCSEAAGKFARAVKNTMFKLIGHKEFQRLVN